MWLIDLLAGEGNNVLEVETELACAKVWKCDVPTKANVLAWRILINRLPTRDALMRRGLLDSIHDTCCILCFGEEESTSHLFFNCVQAREVWKEVFKWLDTPTIQLQDPIQHFIRFGMMLKGRKLKRLKHLVWIATIWGIWQTRNKVLFDGAVANISSIVHHIKQISWGWFASRKGRKTRLNYGDWLNCPLGCLEAV